MAGSAFDRDAKPSDWPVHDNPQRQHFVHVRLPARWFSMGYTPKPDTYREDLITYDQVYVRYDEKHDRISVTFNHKAETYRIDIPLISVVDNSIKVEHFRKREQYRANAMSNRAVHTLILKYPGQLWRKTADAQHFTDQRWERMVALPPSVFVEEGSKLASDYPFPLRHYGQCVTYRIGYSTDKAIANSYYELMTYLKNRKLVPATFNYNDHTLLYTYVKPKQSVRLNHLDRFKRMEHSFELFFTLESYISHYRLHELCIPGEFYTLLCRKPAAVAIDALRIMCSRGESRVWQPLPKIREIFRDSTDLALGHRPTLQPYHTMVYKALVTPTTIQFELPQLELSNRVIRQYWEHADRFLRIQFVDEGKRPLKLHHNDNQNMGRVLQRVRETVRHGIRIGDRYYEFLGFSSSQLRSHGCWFFASTKDVHADDIRAWMGDFSQETVAARYAARMGQCFSTTQPVLAVQPSQIRSLKDIVRNNYTFSDGVGRISQDLADRIAEMMGRKDVPTAFQFRLGGAKGVLTVHKSLKPGIIALRPSQMKFSTKHKVLEINHASGYATSLLNKQIVTALNSLDVPNESFMEILAEMVNSLNDMMTDGNKARIVLRDLMDGLFINRDLSRIVEAGFFDRGDPYIKNALIVHRAYWLKDAKERMRIPIMKSGVTLGVMDETESLNENEVFFRYVDGAGQVHTVEGDVLVYRSPVLHPGDVRMCKAVDCKKLKHLQNVLVFSSKGERDLPSMCGGGDLDGDTFNIIWDERLFPPYFRRNLKPMEYKAAQGPQQSNITIEDVQDFFVEYFLKDQVGQISTTHMAISDGSPKGIFDKNCLELAEAFAIAVDYPKTGHPTNISKETLQVSTFPDFMGRKDKPMYPSTKAMGYIYRSIHPKEYTNYRDDLSNTISDNYYDPRIQAPGMVRYIGAARLQKQYHDRHIRERMTEHGIYTETEVTAGCIVEWKDNGKNKRFYDDLNELRKKMVRFKTVWRSAEFPEHLPLEELEAKAAAWYYVTYHPREKERQVQEAKKFEQWYQGGCGLISFPWIAFDILCDLAEKNTTEEIESGTYPTFDEEAILQYQPKSIPDPYPFQPPEAYDIHNDEGYAVEVKPKDGPRKWF